MKRLLLAALLLPAALQANQLWQVTMDYPDRVQFLAPTPDQSFYLGLLPTLTAWQAEGYILGYGERICNNACVASIIYKAALPMDGAPHAAESPEPGTFALLGICLIAAIGTLWSTRA